MLENVKKQVKEYVGLYNEYSKEFKNRKQYVDENYVKDGSRWAEQYKAIKTMYDNQVFNARKSGIEGIEVIFNDVINKLSSKVTEGVAPEIVAELELLRTTKVTETDIKAYLDKYYNSYLVCKVLKEIAEDKKIEVEVLSINDYIGELESLKLMVIDFFNSYKGPLTSYKSELIINGSIIDRVDDQLNSFIKAYDIV